MIYRTTEYGPCAQHDYNGKPTPARRWIGHRCCTQEDCAERGDIDWVEVTTTTRCDYCDDVAQLWFIMDDCGYPQLMCIPCASDAMDEGMPVGRADEYAERYAVIEVTQRA